MTTPQLTDTEIIAQQDAAIKKLQRRVNRLEKRLLEKKFYETADMVARGYEPRFIAKVDAKDAAALAEE